MTNEPPPLDLKFLRDRADLRQHQLATLLGVDQSQISRWETSPETIPVTAVVSLSRVLGMTVDQLLTGAEIEPALSLRVDDLSRRERLQRFSASVTAVGDSSPELAVRARDGGVRGPAEVDRLVNRVMRKPRVMVVGPFDGGKSTFVNTLLSSRTMPVRYQPTTSLVTVVRHVDDRPTWMQEPMTDWLAQNIGRQNAPAVLVLREGFEIERMDDEDHVREHYLTAGGLDLLEQVGTHGPGTLPDAVYAVCFLDAEILQVCDLVDTPGNNASDDDDRRVESATPIAHVLVQLNPTTGFMSTNQISYLLPGIRSLTPFFDTPAIDRVFVVASHAHAGITDEQLEGILEGGASRLAAAMQADTDALSDALDSDALPASSVTAWWTPETTRTRLFSFYDSNGRGRSRGEPLLTELARLLTQTLPRMTAEHVTTQLNSTVKDLAAQLEQQSASLEAAEHASAELPDLEQEARQVQETVGESRSTLTSAAEHHRRQSSMELHDAFADRLDQNRIEKLIRSTYSDEAFKQVGRSDTSPKKAAQEEIGPLVVSQLQNDLARILEREAREFGTTVDAELESLSTSITEIDVAGGAGVIGYDLRGAFVGAALSTAAVGALAVWASTLGNLGAYIIAAQAAGWLSAIGVSLPAGGATLTAAMAAVGGPVGVAVAIIVIGVLFGLMFRSDWEQRLAKAVVRGFDKADKRSGKTLRQALQDIVTNYWDDTQRSVENGLDNIVLEHQKHLQRFRDLIGDDTSTVTKRRERRELLTDLGQYFQEVLTVITISRRTL